MKHFLFLLTMTIACGSVLSCSKSQTEIVNAPNKVLLLVVDYTTSQFEGGTELPFTDTTPTFTLDTQYVAPGDFGKIKFSYQELGAPLFEGTIIWMGKGAITFPTTIVPASRFQRVLTEDYVEPESFDNIFNPTDQAYDYNAMWQHIQDLVKVREYLQYASNKQLKLFLYTPSVGIGDPADWKWIVLLKK